jgi:hypothetical protein
LYREEACSAAFGFLLLARLECELNSSREVWFFEFKGQLLLVYFIKIGLLELNLLITHLEGKILNKNT